MDENKKGKPNKAQVAKDRLKVGQKVSDKQVGYARAKEFNKYAMEKGISPNFDSIRKADGYMAESNAMTKFYSNPDNVRKMKEGQKEYFKGPSKALVGDQDKLPQHLQESILAAPGMVDMDAPGFYNKSKSKVEQDYARNAISDYKKGKEKQGNYEKKKELEVAAGEGYFHSAHNVNKHSRNNRS